MKPSTQRSKLFLLIAVQALVLIAQGCSFSITQRAVPQEIAGTAFVPPSPTQTFQPIQNTEPTAVSTSSTSCENNLTFQTDLTIPDGSVIQPGASMDKRWEVKNSGTCNWGAGYTLRLIAGDILGSNPEQALYPARSGTNLVIRILFQSPLEPGNYNSAWQAFSPDDNPFGDPIFIKFQVPEQTIEPTP